MTRRIKATKIGGRYDSLINLAYKINFEIQNLFYETYHTDIYMAGLSSDLQTAIYEIHNKGSVIICSDVTKHGRKNVLIKQIFLLGSKEISGLESKFVAPIKNCLREHGLKINGDEVRNKKYRLGKDLV